MAERSGDPKIDAVIESFIRDNPDVTNCGMPLEYMKHEDGKEIQDSQGRCGALSEELYVYAESKGLSGWLADSDSYETFGYADRSEIGNEYDDTHQVVMFQGEDGHEYMVDFAASQYGYKEWPMVQRVKDYHGWESRPESSPPWPEWQRTWSRTAAWPDVEAKAKRLVQGGGVILHRNGYNNIVGTVKGDHGIYEVEIGRDDPASRAISLWSCTCPWDQYAWGRCVVPGTPVTLSDGSLKKIENITIDDRVIDSFGSIQSVIGLYSESFVGNIVRLQITKNVFIDVKDTHPILIVRGDDVRCRNKNGTILKKGGRNRVDFGFCSSTCGCRNPRAISVVSEYVLAKNVRADDYLVRPIDLSVEDIGVIDWRACISTPFEIVDDNISPVTHDVLTRWGTTVTRRSKRVFPRVTLKVAEFFKLSGYFIAEGCIVSNKSVKWSFNENEIDYHNEIAKLVHEIWGMTVKYETGPGSKNIVLSHRDLANAFENLFGKTVMHKRIPEWMMRAQSEVQQLLIDGWLNGDGHIRKTDGRHQIVTVNPTLASQCEILLRRLGHNPYVTIEEAKKPNERNKYLIAWYSVPVHKGGRRFIEDNVQYVRIKQIESMPYEGVLHDLTVDNTESYLANGFSVHNTRQWKKYEGRVCSHALATYWKSLTTPIDEPPPPGQTQAPGEAYPIVQKPEQMALDLDQAQEIAPSEAFPTETPSEEQFEEFEGLEEPAPTTMQDHTIPNQPAVPIQDKNKQQGPNPYINNPMFTPVDPRQQQLRLFNFPGTLSSLYPHLARIDHIPIVAAASDLPAILEMIGRGETPTGITREPIWGEYSGGKIPVPGATPNDFYPHSDGSATPLYHLQDLGWDPDRGEQTWPARHGPEERGRMGEIPLGARVEIWGADPATGWLTIAFSTNFGKLQHHLIRAFTDADTVKLIGNQRMTPFVRRQGPVV